MKIRFLHHEPVIDPEQEAWEELAVAIIQRAIKDYRKAVRRLSRFPDHAESKKTMRECERFFHSRWFELLCDINPELILEQLRKEKAV